MLTLIFVCSLACQSYSSLKAQDTSLPFLSMSFEEAKAFSASTGKLIFIDCYTTWCRPCKWVDANIFTNDTVISFYSANFLCLKMDMEKGEGKKLRKTYNVNAFPTFLFIDRTGAVQERRAGQLSTAMDFVNFALLAMNPFENLRGHELSFESGARSDDFLMNYAKKLSDAYLKKEMRLVLDTLYTQWSDDAFYAQKNFDFYTNLDTDLDGKAVDFFIRNYGEFEQRYGELAKRYLKIIFSYNSLIANSKGDEIAQKRITEKLRSLNESQQAMIEWYLVFNDLKTDSEAQIKHIKEGVKRFEWEEASSLSSYASLILFNSEKTEDWHFALEMIERSLFLEKDPYSMETKASILLKLNREKEAIAVLEEAVKLAQERGVSANRMLIKLEELQNNKH